MEKLELLYLARRKVRWCSHREDFPGRAVDKNPPARTGDIGSVPGWEDPTRRGAVKPRHHNC